jgi:hypothetical protein
MTFKAQLRRAAVVQTVAILDRKVERHDVTALAAGASAVILPALRQWSIHALVDARREWRS